MLEKTKPTKRKYSGIYKRREEFLKLLEENAAAAECQKIKSGKYDDLEKALAEWIREKVGNGRFQK
ncbi:hypothetical protein BpHYR1_037545 [Brachionus plicatilis]|uniref:Uncharacterized protein n=1 Tax=Brachionus plicatilis TaxID=10195 RepID=A0A3M7S019_BRAPC|nr:hypothetical protein BpHYR1_037545 [Brachionus plicatilis]